MRLFNFINFDYKQPPNMTRSYFTVPGILFSSLAWISAAGNGPFQEKKQTPGTDLPEKPNILVFIADDAGMDFGCYGNEVIRTPNIDALAASGLTVHNAFLTTPQCSPSRTSMLSGQFAHTIGTEDLHTGLDENTLLVPRYLREAGYFTGYMLKGHLGSNGHRQFQWYDQGFPGYFRGGWYEKAMDNFNRFLDESANRPFFLWMGFVDPHRPYRDDRVEENRAPRVHDPGQVRVPPYLVDAPETRRDLAEYYDEITRMDGQIGEMIREVERRGLLENTLIVFLSDNGSPFPRAKGCVYDAGIETPLIFSWKGVIEPGVEYENGLVSTIDLAPTLLNVAGVPRPEQMFGRSITGIFTDQTLAGRKYIFSERNWHGIDEHIRAVRNDRYKLIMNAYIEWPMGVPGDLSTSPSWYDLTEARKKGTITGNQAQIFDCPRPVIELYDLEEDPHEFNNLAGLPEYAEVIMDLSGILDDWRRETNDHPAYERRRSDKSDRVTGVRFKTSFHEEYW